MAKAKRFADGGLLITPAGNNQSNTYPFPSTNTGTGTGVGSATTNPGVVQTFNIQPSDPTNQVQPAQQQAFKKGGSVKAKAKVKNMARGGGCEVRGKTKGRMV